MSSAFDDTKSFNPDFYLIIKYNLKKDSFSHETNIKKTEISEIVATYLRAQIGQGVDNSKPNELDIYTIKLKLELYRDAFKVTDDTGNLGLRDGLLMEFSRRIK